jgi:hypothetical protein
MKSDETKDDNASRKPVIAKEPTDFADRLASLSDSQLRKLKKMIDDAVKDRDGKGSVIGQMSDSEFNALKDELISKSEKEKKNV